MLTVREIQTQDIEPLTDYWLTADKGYLHGMGVELEKMPNRDTWKTMLSTQIGQSVCDKQSYCIIWLENKIPVGHCNINKITFGDSAFMHLHLWQKTSRQKGCGTDFIHLTLPYFFENFQLNTLYCEPYSFNLAPHKILEKTGFSFIKEYVTTPGSINFEQPGRLWGIRVCFEI